MKASVVRSRPPSAIRRARLNAYVGAAARSEEAPSPPVLPGGADGTLGFCTDLSDMPLRLPDEIDQVTLDQAIRFDMALNNPPPTAMWSR